MLIEISELHPAAPGKKTGTVVAAGGARFSVWPEQLTQVQVGRRYEVETSERTWQGRTLQSITKITPYALGLGAVAAAAAARTNGHDVGNTYHRADPIDSERTFVCAALTAFIKAGKVEPELGKVTNAIQVLRTAYQRTFGMDDHE
jgi:hypothetical protein